MKQKYVSLTIDTELFKHNFKQSRILKEDIGIKKFLNLFSEYKVDSTFFIVGEIVDIFPEIIEEIIDNGHEIGSHSLTHAEFKNLKSEVLFREIKESKEVLEKFTNERVLGFRSRDFYVSDTMMEFIEKSKYKYDSSVVPCFKIPGWYGIPRAPLHPFLAKKIFPKCKKLLEIPIGVNPILRLPISGAWLRLLGPTWTKLGIKMLIKRGCIPVLYIHPWELIKLPRLKNVPKRVYFNTGEKTFKMIKNVIKNVDAKFVSLRYLMEEIYGF